MNARDIVRNAPNAILYCVTAVVIAVIGGTTYLSATGADSTDLTSLLNTLLNFGALIFGGGAFVAAGSAAKSAAKAEEQTNGVLDQRIQEIVRNEIERGSDNG